MKKIILVLAIIGLAHAAWGTAYTLATTCTNPAAPCDWSVNASWSPATGFPGAADTWSIGAGATALYVHVLNGETIHVGNGGASCTLCATGAVGKNGHLWFESGSIVDAKGGWTFDRGADIQFRGVAYTCTIPLTTTYYGIASSQTSNTTNPVITYTGTNTFTTVGTAGTSTQTASCYGPVGDRYYPASFVVSSATNTFNNWGDAAASNVHPSIATGTGAPTVATSVAVGCCSVFISSGPTILNSYGSFSYSVVGVSFVTPVWPANSLQWADDGAAVTATRYIGRFTLYQNAADTAVNFQPDNMTGLKCGQSTAYGDPVDETCIVAYQTKLANPLVANINTLARNIGLFQYSPTGAGSTRWTFAYNGNNEADYVLSYIHTGNQHHIGMASTAASAGTKNIYNDAWFDGDNFYGAGDCGDDLTNNSGSMLSLRSGHINGSGNAMTMGNTTGSSDIRNATIYKACAATWGESAAAAGNIVRVINFSARQVNGGAGGSFNVNTMVYGVRTAGIRLTGNPVVDYTHFYQIPCGSDSGTVGNCAAGGTNNTFSAQYNPSLGMFGTQMASQSIPGLLSNVTSTTGGNNTTVNDTGHSFTQSGDNAVYPGDVFKAMSGTYQFTTVASAAIHALTLNPPNAGSSFTWGSTAQNYTVLKAYRADGAIYGVTTGFGTFEQHVNQGYADPTRTTCTYGQSIGLTLFCSEQATGMNTVTGFQTSTGALGSCSANCAQITVPNVGVVAGHQIQLYNLPSALINFDNASGCNGCIITVNDANGTVINGTVTGYTVTNVTVTGITQGTAYDVGTHVEATEAVPMLAREIIKCVNGFDYTGAVATCTTGASVAGAINYLKAGFMPTAASEIGTGCDVNADSTCLTGAAVSGAVDIGGVKYSDSGRAACSIVGGVSTCSPPSLRIVSN